MSFHPNAFIMVNDGNDKYIKDQYGFLVNTETGEWRSCTNYQPLYDCTDENNKFSTNVISSNWQVRSGCFTLTVTPEKMFRNYMGSVGMDAVYDLINAGK